jgi:hypothetical protein
MQVGDATRGAVRDLRQLFGRPVGARLLAVERRHERAVGAKLDHCSQVAALERRHRHAVQLHQVLVVRHRGHVRLKLGQRFLAADGARFDLLDGDVLAVPLALEHDAKRTLAQLLAQLNVLAGKRHTSPSRLLEPLGALSARTGAAASRNAKMPKRRSC